MGERKGTGDFFAVDVNAFEEACLYGLNAATAYLVLARFSDGSNRYSKASGNAVTNYTPISRRRSTQAVETLKSAELIVNESKSVMLPRYHLVPWDGEAGWAWLPNTIVDSAAGERSPLTLLHHSQNLDALRLFVHLYSLQELDEEDGIGRRWWRSAYREVLRLESSPHLILGFERVGEMRADEYVIDLGSNDDYWATWELLFSLGLLDEVMVVTQSASPDSEILFACDLEGGEEEEHVFTAFMRNEALRRVPANWLPDPSGIENLVVVPKHMLKVAAHGVARLRYRPRTSKTAAWWGQKHEQMQDWVTMLRPEAAAPVVPVAPAAEAGPSKVAVN